MTCYLSQGNILSVPWKMIIFLKENRSFCVQKFLQLLKASSVYVIYADENIPELEMEDISQKWNKVYSKGSHPVLGTSFLLYLWYSSVVFVASINHCDPRGHIYRITPFYG